MTASRDTRYRRLQAAGALDVLVVGGGISGAPVYQKLRLAGYRVGLIDQGDFSSGTSQASGMLIWGGLLYLTKLDFKTVLKLCKARSDLMRDFPADVTSLDLDYRVGVGGNHGAAEAWLALQLYWLMGGCKLKRPRMVKDPPAVRYQEAMLRESDSRFVIDRIRGLDSEHGIALNHCRLAHAEFDPGRRIWNIGLRDGLDGREHEVRARAVVNAAGVWADSVNRTLGVDSPYKHVFSKGVYLAFPNDGSERVATVYPMRQGADVITHVPWGPVTMWGPTETAVSDLARGLTPDRQDVRCLLEEAKLNLPGRRMGAEDVVSVRCGVRPLAVPAAFRKDVYPLTLSRRHRLVADEAKRALAIYGGKLTGSLQMADVVEARIRGWLEPRFPCEPPVLSPPERAGVHGFVTPEWARDHEFCVTLDDYVRRRTSIAQWTPRMGLGSDGGGRPELLGVAKKLLTSGDDTAAETMVSAYEERVRSTYDPLLDF
jgi:glycerol-3-phosphate dehydrogenase